MQAILHSPIHRSRFFPIVTPLKADNWERRIKEAGLEAEYGDIPNCIQYSFSHGLDRTQAARTTYIPNNLKSAIDHPEVISAYLEKEQELGRILEAYDPVYLESQIGPFRCSPVGCLQKDAPHGKWRMFNTLSGGVRPASSTICSKIDM
jgi:hypothetical protein